MYDTIAEGVDYEDRFNWLIRYLPIAATMTLIKNTVVDSYDEAKMLHNVHLAQGYEGSMLRLNKPYEQKRSYNLQKFKDFSDTEATIVGYEAGKGKFTGLIGKFFMQDDDGNEFGCPIGKGYNFADRKVYTRQCTRVYRSTCYIYLFSANTSRFIQTSAF